MLLFSIYQFLGSLLMFHKLTRLFWIQTVDGSPVNYIIVNHLPLCSRILFPSLNKAGIGTPIGLLRLDCLLEDGFTNCILCSKNNYTLFKYMYAYKHDTRYIFEKVDGQAYLYKRFLN